MEKKKAVVSTAVIRRLPRYYRYLGELEKKGIAKISSKDLSELIHVTASQIRQDLNCFGDFGQQGYGYNVSNLRQKIAGILGIDREYRAVVVGVGHLGFALANHNILMKSGVKLIGLFDNDPTVVGSEVAGKKVLHIDLAHDFCRENTIDIAVLTLPKAAAEEVARTLADAGVKGFWNFANTELRLPDLDVKIENVHMGDSLMTLCFHIS